MLVWALGLGDLLLFFDTWQLLPSVPVFAPWLLKPDALFPPILDAYLFAGLPSNKPYSVLDCLEIVEV